MTVRAPLICLAAGGTGGHVFPAEALADELTARGYRLALITDQRGEKFGGRLDVIERHSIRASAVSGVGFIGRVRAALNLFAGYLQAKKILRGLKPDVVVGFGGYPSVPTMLAAGRNRKIHTAIHEQNAVLGRANRLLAPRMDKIATAFDETAELRPADQRRAVRTGNPVRPAISALSGNGYPTPEPDGPFHLLIVGGSQGAKILGDVVPAALASLPDDQMHRLRVVQQVRDEQIDAVGRAYKDAGIQAVVKRFFDDMPQRLAAAHLVISRAGASTIAELTSAGRPALLVPYRYAIDDHQTVNAARLCDAAGAWLIPEPDLTPQTLAERLGALMASPHTLATAAEAAARTGAADAASRLADVVAELAGPEAHPVSTTSRSEVIA